MNKTTAFFMATTAFLAGIMIGSSMSGCKKGKISIGDNNFFGLKVVSGTGKDKCCKLPASCSKEDTISAEPDAEEVTAD